MLEYAIEARRADPSGSKATAKAKLSQARDAEAASEVEDRIVTNNDKLQGPDEDGKQRLKDANPPGRANDHRFLALVTDTSLI